MANNITMERIIKTEMQPDGQVLLYYLDENGETEQGILSTMEGEEDGQGQAYTIVEEIDDSMIQYEVNEQQETVEEPTGPTDEWIDEEIRRALIFYIDNKETFVSGQTRQHHLWTVACKTMLPHKTAEVCESKIRSLKEEFAQICFNRVDQGVDEEWQFYDLCHQAFNNDKYVNQLIKAKKNDKNNHEVSFQSEKGTAIKTKRSQPDPTVERMLRLYLSCKKAAPRMNERWQKTIFQKIAAELGEDSDYWRKRFLNFKNHYIKLLDKNKCGSLTENDITWPYFQIFENIFEGDKDFQKRYGSGFDVPLTGNVMDISMEVQQEVPDEVPQDVVIAEEDSSDWNTTEQTVLVKYYFDAFQDFQDAAVPKDYLWGEIGRLLDKTPEECQQKYEELKTAHFNKYDTGTYNLNTRKPIEILFDNIIYTETEQDLSDSSENLEPIESWSVEQVDILVQFFCDNLELLNDSMCNYVCWAAVSKKLNEYIQDCRLQWKDLVSLYKSILNDKKENPDMQIDWRYTEMFDRIFDFGTNTKLLDEFNDNTPKKKSSKTATCEPVSDNEDYHESQVTDKKQLKLLEYYIKHKDKFVGRLAKKTQWQDIAKELGFTPDQCTLRFKNLKQVYTAYVQKEVNSPDQPILWPYYELCKKAFGYRIVKNQVKQKSDTYVTGEWQPKEIKTLIKHYSKQYNPNYSINDIIDWSEVSRELKRSETACRDKFFDLRKSYRQIKTMVDRGGNCKVSWKYYNLFDAMYSQAGVEETVVPYVESNEEVPNVQDISNTDVVYNQEDISNTEIITTEGLPNIEVISAESLSNAEVISEEALSNAQVISAEELSNAEVISAEALSNAQVISAEELSNAEVISAELSNTDVINAHTEIIAAQILSNTEISAENALANSVFSTDISNSVVTKTEVITEDTEEEKLSTEKLRKQLENDYEMEIDVIVGNGVHAESSESAATNGPKEGQ